MFVVPFTGLCVAVTELPYDVVVPYSNVTVALELFAFTVPFNVAVVVPMELAAFVVTVGAAALVVNV